MTDRQNISEDQLSVKWACSRYNIM